MASRTPLDRLTANLDLRWLDGPHWDESAVYLETTGEVAALPDVFTVERAAVALGFECQVTEGPFGTMRVSGRRGKERLSCVLLPASVYRGERIRGAEVKLEWRSGERPALVGGVVEWHGRRWPAFFEEPCLYFESRTLLIVEGRIADGGLSECLARYRAWANETGLSSHEECEPDLNGDAGFADDAFVVTVQDRRPFATMTVRRRDEGEAADARAPRDGHVCTE
jgi:hypothetical protein